jgi:hypothetical protein
MVPPTQQAAASAIPEMQRQLSYSQYIQQQQIQRQPSAPLITTNSGQPMLLQQLQPLLQQLYMLQLQLASSLPPELAQQQQQNLLMQQHLLSQVAHVVQLQPASMTATAAVIGQLHDQQSEQCKSLSQDTQRPAARCDSARAAFTTTGDTAHVPLAPRKTAADLFAAPGPSPAAGTAAPDTLDPSYHLSDASELLLGSNHSLQQLDSGPDDADALFSQGVSAPLSFDMSRLQAIIDKVYPGQDHQQQQQHAAQLVFTQHIGGSTGPGDLDDRCLQQPQSVGAFGRAFAAAEAAIISPDQGSIGSNLLPLDAAGSSAMVPATAGSKVKRQTINVI